MDGNTLNGQLTSEVVTCLVEHWYKLIGIQSVYEILFSISNMWNNNYYLNRHGFNPSYDNLYPPTANFYTTMSLGRA